MKRSEIEWRIKAMQKRLAEVTHPKDIAATNRVIEKLIMMDAEDDNPPTPLDASSHLG